MVLVLILDTIIVLSIFLKLAGMRAERVELRELFDKIEKTQTEICMIGS